jgi:hypothetical protein
MEWSPLEHPTIKVGHAMLAAAARTTRCGQVRAAWVLGLGVQSSVMSDDYQSTTSECAKPTCNHPFDSVQRADSHSAHATLMRSLWGMDVMEFLPCVWTVTVENLEQMQNGKLMMDIISALMQPW